jgi:hypothetical protein
VEAEFYREDAPDQIVGRAVWDGRGIRLNADDDTIRETLTRIFRPVPVVIEDPSLRSYGTSGPVQLAPGSLQWFRAAAESRAEGHGVRVRFVAGTQPVPGWDPAGAYRTFNQQIERRVPLRAERAPA